MMALIQTAILFAATLLAQAPASTQSIGATIDAAEPKAVLAILNKLRSRTPVASADWNALFATRGYQRLKQREAQFKRPFTDDQFKAFVASPKLIAQSEALSDTLARWMSADLTQMAQRSFAYLPPGATIHATIYPLIKPKTNSFVYELNTDPAVMLYLDPSVSKNQFANTVSHELLHVGDAQNCPPPAVKAQETAFNQRQKDMLEWLSAFGEGWAVLAAAGGPNIHPHWMDSQADRDVWDKAMSHYNSDFVTLRQFFSDIASGRLTGDAIPNKGYTYFGEVQGPWYTVGYKMDVTIEKAFGRPRLVQVLCDKRQYFATYNAAAAKSKPALPLWPESLVNFLISAPLM